MAIDDNTSGLRVLGDQGTHKQKQGKLKVFMRKF